MHNEDVQNEILTRLFMQRSAKKRKDEKDASERAIITNSINYYQFHEMVTLNIFQKIVLCLDIKSHQAIFLSGLLSCGDEAVGEVKLSLFLNEKHVLCFYYNFI